MRKITFERTLRVEGRSFNEAVENGHKYGIIDIDEAARLEAVLFEQMTFTVGTHTSRVAPTDTALLVLSTNASGTLESTFDGDRSVDPVSSGIMTFVPPGVAQDYDFEGRTTNIVTLIQGRLLDDIRDRNPELRGARPDEPRRAFVAPRLARLVTDQNRLVRTGEMGWRSLAEANMIQLGVEILRTLANSGTWPAGPVPLSPGEIARVDDYLRANLDRNVPLGEVAEVADRTPEAFSRAWREATGETFHRHAIQLRLEEAQRRLVSTREPIAEVALSTGFSSQAHMTTTMQKRWGVTPGRLRTLALA